MTARASDARDPNRLLRRVHAGALGVLVACAVLIAVAGAAEAPSGVRRVTAPFTYAALALAAGSIVTRRRASVTRARRRAYVSLSFASLLCAAGLGIVGFVAARAGAPRDTALLYVLGGAIFALRRPSLQPGQVQGGGP